MYEATIFSGFGGQGALFAGQLLAYAALDFGANTTWIPSYGPEMRGGTAHCTVIVSDEPIGSPAVRTPTSVVALNLPSFQNYEPSIVPGGLLVFNASLIAQAPRRTDIRYVAVPANDMAEKLGNLRMANVVLLGAYLSATGVLPPESVLQALEAHLPARQRKYLQGNRDALMMGTEYGQHQPVK
jgi:2-oxoglutarate ferredoxin oxidoreductase subunit gamma